MGIVAKHKRARFDYQIGDTIMAGLVLTGPEVKSCRVGQIGIAGAYVVFEKGIPLLRGASIAAYKYAATVEHEPKRDRTLLLRKSDITKIKKALDEKGVTVVPLEVHAGRTVKILLGLAKGQ